MAERPTPQDPAHYLARLLAALQVPVSLHHPLLVEVGPIFDEARDAFSIWGWSSAEEIEASIKSQAEARP